MQNSFVHCSVARYYGTTAAPQYHFSTVPVPSALRYYLVSQYHNYRGSLAQYCPMLTHSHEHLLDCIVFGYWCYDHRNRNRFLTEHRIESKSYFSCILSNDLSIEALDRLLTPSRFNASTDRPHTAARAVVCRSSVDGRRSAGVRERWQVRGRTSVVPGQTRPTYRYRLIITWHWSASERWLRIFFTVSCLLCIYLSICRPDT